ESPAGHLNWPVLTHVPRQTTELPKHLETRPDEYMIGVCQDYLRAQFLKLSRADGFDAALRSHRHEGRRLDGAVISFEQSYPRFCAFISRSYFKHWTNLRNDRTTRKRRIL